MSRNIFFQVVLVVMLFSFIIGYIIGHYSQPEYKVCTVVTTDGHYHILTEDVPNSHCRELQGEH